MKAGTAGRKLSAVFDVFRGGKVFMNEQTKAQVEAYAEECRTEQLELLRTLGKMPAPTRKTNY